jgi:hypothetical protein
MFRPKPRVKSLAELNAWLEDQCIAYAQRIKHPEFKDRCQWRAEFPQLWRSKIPQFGGWGDQPSC